MATFGSIAQRLGYFGTGLTLGRQARADRITKERQTLLDTAAKAGAAGQDIMALMTPDMVSDENKPFVESLKQNSKVFTAGFDAKEQRDLMRQEMQMQRTQMQIDAADRRTQMQIDAADRRAEMTNARLNKEKEPSLTDKIKVNEFVTEQVQKSLMGKLSEVSSEKLKPEDAGTVNAYTQTILRKMRADGVLNLNNYKTPEELAAQVDRYIVNVQATPTRKFAPTVVELEPGSGITVEPAFKQNILDKRQEIMQISPLQRPVAVDKYILMLKQNTPSLTLAQEEAIRRTLNGLNGQ